MTGAIVNIVIGVFGFIFKKLFPKKTQSQRDNARERSEAAIARKTQQDARDDQEKIDHDTADTAGRVQSDSVQSAADEISQDVDRANSDVPKQ